MFTTPAINTDRKLDVDVENTRKQTFPWFGSVPLIPLGSAGPVPQPLSMGKRDVCSLISLTRAEFHRAVVCQN